MVGKKNAYQALSQQYGRSPSAYEYRFRNISHVLTTMGLPTLAGLPAAGHVGPTAEGTIRRVIESKSYFGSELVMPTADAEQLERRTQALRRRGVPAAPPVGSTHPPRTTSTISLIVRNPLVKAWVLEKAAGRCECCNQPAPFHMEDGTPYLEVHHVRWLSKGGSDTVSNAMALCPNCHRRFHHSDDADVLVDRAYAQISRLRKE